MNELVGLGGCEEDGVGGDNEGKKRTKDADERVDLQELVQIMRCKSNRQRSLICTTRV